MLARPLHAVPGEVGGRWLWHGGHWTALGRLFVLGVEA